MDTLINEIEVNEICQKLASVSEGKTNLSQNDAEDILALIANLITMNVDKRREEVEASIFEYLGESAVIENLGGEKLMDETFVQYLTANYTKALVKGSGVTNYDLEGIGGSEIAADESGSSEVSHHDLNLFLSLY